MPAIKIYAETINGGTAAEIEDERTMVRMTALLSKGESSNNKVTVSTLTVLLNKYAGSGVTSVAEASTDIIQVTFNATGNIYEIDANTGPIFDTGEYTITYNANGGTGAPAAQTATKGEATTLSSTNPTRTGYVFKGWATTSDATTATYSAGGSYTGSVDVTLYAVWGETYTITFDANGGSGGPGTQTAEIGEEITISTTKPTRTGHTFLGWATTSDATASEYSAGGSYTGSVDVTLYAVWQINSYTLTLNANGGTFPDGSTTNSQTTTYGSAVTLPTADNSPTRDGYEFLGWSTSSTATTAAYEAGDSCTINSTKTLYAVWQSTSTTYTITLNANGGFFGASEAIGTTTKTYTVNAGESITLSDTPSKGYTIIGESKDFLGWGISSTSTTVRYSDGATITPTGDMTLYAVWGTSSSNNNISTSKLDINNTKVSLIPKRWTSLVLGF